MQAQGRWGAGPDGRAALAHPDLVSWTHFPHNSTSLAHSSEKGPPWDVADLSGLPPAVVETITQARAPSTRQTYALKWSLFANWCSSRREDPRRCTIGVVLSFLQERLEHRLSPSTLKYMWPLSLSLSITDRGNGDVMSPCHNLEPSLVARDSFATLYTFYTHKKKSENSHSFIFYYCFHYIVYNAYIVE